MATSAVSPSSTVSFLGSLLMFLSSYAPLFLVLAIRTSSWRLSLAWLVVALFGFVGLQGILRGARSTTPEPIEAHSIEPRSAEVAAYLASYLVAFVAGGPTGGRDLISLGIYLVVLAVVYIRTGLMYINPVLAIQGYRLVSATTRAGDDEIPVVVLTKSDSVRPRRILGVRIANGVYLETQ